MNYELIIVGGGPAGSAAAIYAARKQLKTLIIAEEFGGQSAVSNEIYNWIGTVAISGTDLAMALKNHVEQYSGENKSLQIKSGQRVENITKTTNNDFLISLTDGETFTSRAVLIASGSSHRKLEVPGTKELDHKGVMYCATCDAPLFQDMNVAIIGGGNAAFEGVLQAAQYSPTVTLIHRNENFKADPITIEEVKKLSNVKIIPNTQVKEVYGTNFVEGLKYQTQDSTEMIDLKISGLFVEIGQIPNTNLVKGLVELDEFNRIKVDTRNQRTNINGIWAAGDCTDGLYHQNNIAAGDAIKAVENIFVWIKTGK